MCRIFILFCYFRDAPRLWKDTSSIDAMNNVVEAWLITLEKQGCHHLMIGDPAAVQQAIVLSLGSLRFSNQHLEFNIDPQYLNRDYLFRYGIKIFLIKSIVNISFIHNTFVIQIDIKKWQV